MTSPEEAARKAAAAYNAAADFYDHPANSFWDRYGRDSVARLSLAPGAHVFDACCGSGASALPAAQAVGPSGSVLGIDLAENLLDLARTKAKDRGLENVAFRGGDILNLGLPSASFHAVVCVFGIFFVPDMDRAVRELWRLVRPEGRLGITTWGPRFFEPVNTVFWNAVRAVRPDLYKGFNPWDRICEPDALRDLLGNADVKMLEIAAEAGSHVLRRPEDWRAMVLGTGYRGTVEQLDAEARAQVRRDCLEFIHATGVRTVEANVVYAVGTKGPS
jgi:ubiquinone/menaquinone biosynthesis C-methylase UbiE